MNQKFDMVIPAVAGDIPFLPMVVKYVRLNLPDAECIYVVTNKKNFSKRPISRLKNEIILLDENSFLPGMSYNAIRDLLIRNNQVDSPGWYLQQFIKLGFALTEYAKEYYLTWDADTLPLSKIQYFQDGHPVFTIKKECHLAYFETITNLIGLKKIKDESFIAEHMMFKTSIVNELIHQIDKSDVEGRVWFEKCMNACNFESKYNGPYFSEFETYGTYCFNKYPELYYTQKLNTFRSAGFIRGRYISDKILKKMSYDLDTASFEIYDKPLFPYNIPYYVDLLQRKLRRITMMSSSTIVNKLFKKLIHGK